MLARSRSWSDLEGEMMKQSEVEEAVLELLPRRARRTCLQGDLSKALIARDILKDPEEFEDFL